MSKLPADKFIRMSIKELTTPTDGRVVYLKRWWCVTDNDEALFFRSYSSPQCNDNKAICDRFGVKAVKTRPVFIEVAYVPIVWSDHA